MFVSYSFSEFFKLPPTHNKILLVPLKTIGPLKKVFSTPMYTNRVFFLYVYI